MFEPALLIWFSIDVRAPVPIATMTITAATPMIMPSAVSAVRIALRRSALTATMNVIKKDMGSYAIAAAICFRLSRCELDRRACAASATG